MAFPPRQPPPIRFAKRRLELAAEKICGPAISFAVNYRLLVDNQIEAILELRSL
jgi:hypothetical protein